MRDNLEASTILTFIVLYALIFWALTMVGAIAPVIAAVYIVFCMGIYHTLLEKDIKQSSGDSISFRKSSPLPTFGLEVATYQYSFNYETDIRLQCTRTMMRAVSKQGFLHQVKEQALTDIHTALRTSQSRTVSVAFSEPNACDTRTCLVLFSTAHGTGQTIQWHILLTGFVSLDRRIWATGWAPFTLPFLLIGRLDRDVYLSTSIRKIHDSFFNVNEVVSGVRSTHKLLTDNLAEVLRIYDVDVSDLVAQANQILTVNVNGNAVSIGQIGQAMGRMVMSNKEGKIS